MLVFLISAIEWAKLIVGPFFILTGVLTVCLFGFPIQKADRARERAPIQDQLAYYTSRRWNAVFGVFLTLAGFYIAGW